MLDILKTFRKQRAALSASLDGLDELRAQIAAKKLEIVRVQRAPRPLSDALTAFDQWCDDAVTRAVDRVGIEHLIQPGNSGALQLPIVRLRGETAPDLTGAVETLLGLLILTNRDALRGVIEGQLGDLTGGRETLGEDAREERVEALRAEVLQLE
ncbi:hypothetical protein EOM89_11325, partial [Candidatus Falkowbacteria bacterium]|nr:hypothetical protein [Candidatus Falkowbacteria bacterium]